MPHNRACHRALALSLGTVLSLTACSGPYVDRVTVITPPDRAPDATQIPGTEIKVAALFYNTKDSLKHAFPENSKWLWKAHIALTQVTFESNDERTTQVLLDSGYITIGGQDYPIISPHQTFDMAWGKGNPLARVEDDAYNTAVMLFTFVTLGVGSLVWVLPSPFEQPAPEATPFSRDINYKALSGNFTLMPGSLRSGLIYVALPESMDLSKLQNAKLVLHLVTETPKPVPHEISIDLPPAKPAA